MAGQDRKRAFSQAFNFASNNMSNPIHQAAQNVLRPFVAPTPQTFYSPPSSFESNKENEIPFFDGGGAAIKPPGNPQASYQHQQDFVRLAVCRHCGHPLQDASQQCLPTDSVADQMLPLPTTRSAGDFSHLTLPTSATDHDQSPFISSPLGFKLGGSSSLDKALAACLDSASGPVIYEDPDTMMCDGKVFGNPRTPSDLNLQDLSLRDGPRRPLSTLAPRPVPQHHRASVHIVPTAMFDGTFDNVMLNEIVIAFDKGNQVVKVDKYMLCHESRFFAEMLDGPFLELHTRCIRLRDGFPYGIKAMAEFVEKGVYVFDPMMLVEYPHITLIDLHVHAYLVGNKYQVPRLCDYAIAQYVNFAQLILSLGVTADDFHAVHPAAPRDPNDPSPAAVTDRFLDSLVLIWKNTASYYDPMRAAVLEIVKLSLNQLMQLRFFVTMMLDLEGFGDDVVHSLQEDGFDVMAFPVPVGMEHMWGVRFGGL